MSERNGAKARFHLHRKARLSRKAREREMQKALQEKDLKGETAKAVKSAAN